MKYNNWKKMKLQGIIDINPRETLKKGALAKKISMADLTEYTRKVQNFEITEYTSGSKFKNGDTLMARITPCLENGKTAFIDILDDDEIAFGSTEFFVLRAKEGLADPKFIYYLAISDEIRNVTIQSMTGTSGRQRAQKEAILEYEKSLPDYESQMKISKILSMLDEKIEMNNQIMRTLDGIAFTLFKHWFVDFEFPDKNGNPYKSNGGKMIDSELGVIPEGWEIKKISEIAKEVITGKTPSTKDKDNYGSDIPFIKIPDMHGKNFVDETGSYLSKQGINKRKLLPEKSICVSCIATPGLVSMNVHKSQTNQQINTIIPTEENRYFLFLNLQSKSNLIKELGSGGSATLNLNKTEFEKIKLIVPNSIELQNFNHIIDPVMNKLLNFQLENGSLQKIRDTLLPKLLSGEIELPIEEEV